MQSKANKIIIVGVDGMDPRLTRKYVDEGLMPNVQRLIEQGACREDLVMLGGHPTVTPPMWTTLATGAYPCTHGITAFGIPDDVNLGYSSYGLDSAKCRAEQLWNVTAEAGLKTLVFHWPGSSWPPSSDSPNLHVVDGTQPAAPNMGVAQVESEFILVASPLTEAPTYRKKAATDTNVPCVITDLDFNDDGFTVAEAVDDLSKMHIILNETESQNGLSDSPFDVVLSPIKDAAGWADAPEGAKEFVMLFSQGTIRRVGQILPSKDGVYDTVKLYANKKTAQPFATLKKGVFTPEILDEALKNDVKYSVNRNMRILEMAPDGSYLKMWVSAAMDYTNDTVWHPTRLYQSVVDVCGYPSPEVMLGGGDKMLIYDCMIANWDYMAEWESKAIHHLIDTEAYDVVFSHFHNVDGEGHMVIKNLKGTEKLSEAEYQKILETMYIQTDRYIGSYFDLLEAGWTVLVVSDHAQVCPVNKPPFLCDGCGIDYRVMHELGYTFVKYDEAGKELHEIDWSKTKAVAKSNFIYLNIKGRNPNGIIDPADQYDEEEKLMTALYGYKHPDTGNRVVALALRNKDAVLLGLGGPNSGDIVIWLAEGYNFDHVDSISTTYGYGDTSVSPIFIAAGPGIKPGYTQRIIREVDVAPTVAVLAGVRMPKECEGAPVYQILA